jgi:hypothetical protein
MGYFTLVFTSVGVVEQSLVFTLSATDHELLVHYASIFPTIISASLAWSS